MTSRVSTFEALRQRYPEFSYESFSFACEGADLRARFVFAAAPDLRFSPSIVLRDAAPAATRRDPRLIRTLVFHLGLIEALSYWKATCSPAFTINCGCLSDDQQRWWVDLFQHGMGEFLFTNGLDVDLDRLIAFRNGRSTERFDRVDDRGEQADDVLVPIGGGRDSALVTSALRDAGFSMAALLLNPTIAASDVAEVGGVRLQYRIDRTIEPALLELNERGFLNGHTPFSAYLAVVGSLVLYLQGHRTLVLANERSADSENITIGDRTVNHQYSKTLRFEAAYDDYLRRYLIADGRYLSLLRPLYELQIARAFSSVHDMLAVFRSCNRARASNGWCGECAKCVSVFVTMYPFVSREQLLAVFGGDWYENERIVPVLLALAGEADYKPFECVCTAEETRLALLLAAEKARRELGRIPVALTAILRRTHSPTTDLSALSRAILDDFGPHRLPPRLADIARRLATRDE